jgi:hypothetical protein
MRPQTTQRHNPNGHTISLNIPAILFPHSSIQCESFIILVKRITELNNTAVREGVEHYYGKVVTVSGLPLRSNARLVLTLAT